jgi:NAD(P)H-dependent flavin oxidoreductase YrpB (nitropropane dioxygenase family)
VGLPGRAINNSFLEDVSRGVRKPFKCSWKCLKTCQLKKAPYCIASALTNAKKGNLLEGFSFAGVNAYLSEKISSVREVIASLIEEYDRSLVENQLAFRPV